MSPSGTGIPATPQRIAGTGHRIPWHETVVYECHVKGLSMRHPEIPPDLRGTYAGLAHPAVIEHLRRLGVTAVELMPVHRFVHDHYLIERGLRNYWGYNSIGFFAPHNEYSAWGVAQVVSEFRYLVKTLHEAGIEVILDVVYNHTAEGNHLGPVLSFKGIDNRAYYRLADGRYYFDTTGTGNTLNMRHPHVLQLIIDSLRHWVTEMHVDGFRFDLAASLARQFHEVDRLSAFFDLIQVDPVVSQVKLIAEPWDLGDGGYQVGNFPTLWSEWNGRYRDTVRDYWRSADGTLPDLAYRLTGSSDLYGQTDDPAILEIRERRRRALITTLLVSQGVPMVRHGDELGHSQRGNNNAYCQDNELSWLDWEHADKEFLDFCAELVAFRRRHPVFRRRHFFEGRPIFDTGLSDIGWFRLEGRHVRAPRRALGRAVGSGLRHRHCARAARAAARGDQGRGRRPRCADIPARIAVIALRARGADYFISLRNAGGTRCQLGRGGRQERSRRGRGRWSGVPASSSDLSRSRWLIISPRNGHPTGRTAGGVASSSLSRSCPSRAAAR